MPNAEKILYNNNFIDRVFTWTDENRMILRNVEFDIMYNGDKSDYACAFANEVNSKEKFGFLLNNDGKIIPANKVAGPSMLKNKKKNKFPIVNSPNESYQSLAKRYAPKIPLKI